MIPPSMAKRIVIRFERAVHVRACALAVGQSAHAITFEYRQSKRELLNLIHLLSTGENPDNSLEDKVTSTPLFGPTPSVGTASSEPKNPSPR